MQIFLRNAWYPAAWAEEISDKPLRRRLLAEPVALFRTAAGAAVALADICPHRFAPLSSGRLVEGTLQCPYHGLRFATDGHCAFNPHGDGRIPPNAKVRPYPLLERDGLVWIWMGASELADPGKLPDFSILAHRQDYAVVAGRSVINANYQLVADNLLDLSHVDYLHPYLRTDETVAPRLELVEDGESLWAMRHRPGVPPNILLRQFYDQPIGDARAHMRWNAPGVMLLDVGITACGAPEADGVSLPQLHLLCPETETSTHYFWAALRNRRVDDRGLDERIRAGLLQTFEQEDKPIIEAQEENLQGRPFETMRPVMLAPDGPAQRARRLMSQRIAAEATA